MENISNNEVKKTFWSEKIFIVTKDYEIKGYICSPKTIKKERMLTDLLDSNKRFIAIKDVEIASKNDPDDIENHDFIQLKIDEIVLLKPVQKNN